MTDDDVIERLARALCLEYGVEPDERYADGQRTVLDYTDEAQRFTQTLRSAGLSLYPTETHVAVPREPDDERAGRGTEACDGAISIPEAKRVYRAMIRTEGEG